MRRGRPAPGRGGQGAAGGHGSVSWENCSEQGCRSPAPTAVGLEAAGGDPLRLAEAERRWLAVHNEYVIGQIVAGLRAAAGGVYGHLSEPEAEQ
jgi:hypothetical protein